MSETRSARIVLEKGKSAEAKGFVQDMIADHQKSTRISGRQR
jgi:predicted outer membrane protein